MKATDWRLRSEHYDFQCLLTPLFTQVGIERHINNVAMQGLYLEARLRHRMRLLGGQSWCADDGVLLRPRATITHFMRETHYPADVTVAVRLVELDTDRYRLVLAMFQDGHCVGVQECLMGAWHDGGWIALPSMVGERLSAALAPVPSLPDWPPVDTDVALDGLPVEPVLTPRFADRDADRHLSEKSVARYLEHACMSTLDRLRQTGQILVMARADIDYHRWVPGLPGVGLRAGIARIGNRSVVVRGAVRMDRDTVAVSDNVLVALDRVSRRPVLIDDAQRRAMQALSV